MARTLVQRGDTLTLIAPAKVASGDIIAIGSLVGVAAFDAESGAEVETHLTGVHMLPKATPLEINPGDALWIDAGAKKLNKTPAGNTLAGVAVAHAGSSDATVLIRLGGADPTALAAAVTALTERVVALENA